MASINKDNHAGQALYLGRWVDKTTFRAFVYDDKGNQKLAKSYPEFESLTGSGLWFPAKRDVSSKVRKQKDVIRSDS